MEISDYEKHQESFDQLFDTVSSYFAENAELSKELVNARKEFFDITGKLAETDKNYHNRINAFLLWFTFDWRTGSTLKTPFELFLMDLRINGDRGSLKVFSELSDHIHSLFEFVKTKDSSIIIRDIFTKSKYEINDSAYLMGISKGEFFETRIFRLNNRYHFSNYFIYHPFETKRVIIKQCKQLKKSGKSIKPFLFSLHSSHTKWGKYRNIDIKSIYHFDKSIPLAK